MPDALGGLHCRICALTAACLLLFSIAGCDDPVEPGPELAIDSENLTFAFSKRGQAPTPATFRIQNDGSGTLDWTAATEDAWLRVEPASGTAPAEVTVSVQPLLAPLGQHTGAISITTEGSEQEQVEVAITVETDPSTELVFAQSSDGPHQLYRLDLETGAIQQLTDDSHHHALPDVSPSGDAILFRHVDEDHSLVGTIGIDGSEFQEVAEGASATWSPDGQRIAFTGPEGENLNVANANGTNARTIVESPFVDRPDWSPDGTKIAFTTALDLHVVEVESGAVLNLTYETDDPFGFPNWSPSGEWIAFQSMETRSSPTKLSVIRPDGRDRTRIDGLPPANQFLPTWSPDGTRIAFIRQGQQNLPGGIWIAELDGTNAVSAEWIVDGTDPAWIP